MNKISVAAVVIIAAGIGFVEQSIIVAVAASYLSLAMIYFGTYSFNYEKPAEPKSWKSIEAIFNLALIVAIVATFVGMGLHYEWAHWFWDVFASATCGLLVIRVLSFLFGRDLLKR